MSSFAMEGLPESIWGLVFMCCVRYLMGELNAVLPARQLIPEVMPMGKLGFLGKNCQSVKDAYCIRELVRLVRRLGRVKDKRKVYGDYKKWQGIWNRNRQASDVEKPSEKECEEQGICYECGEKIPECWCKYSKDGVEGEGPGWV
ncbi:hypothetical protein [Camellia chlorotic dwarf-associated virus]|uniref:V2 n=1 Tax=Camellia chlorotic dwarf-associated virus TaxID=2122733 RepID=A0A2P1JHH5_9GEMI|nr:hypothetical protein [Camellia chlorotic dwarf-associated virus]AVN97894.1 hypothetical protein [Camellia chlorotic dwarf-associated virus]